MDSNAVPGRYFLADSSHFFAASLSRDAQGIALKVESFIDPLRPIVFERSQPLARLPTKLTFPDGSVFEVFSDEGLLSILGEPPGFFDGLKRYERSTKSILLAVFVTIAVTLGFWRWGIPASAMVTAWATPPILTQAMDFGTLKTLDQSLLSVSKLSANQQSKITTDFERLVTLSGLPSDRLTIVFRDAPSIGPNALTLPGGTILLTDQLVALSRSADEVAGVLAHEIGHVSHRHSLRLIYQALGISFFITMVSGDPGSMIDSVVQQASALQSLSYTREFEREADHESVELMHRLGRDPLAFLTLLERIDQQKQFSGETSFLSTHPGVDERRAEILQRLNDLLRTN